MNPREDCEPCEYCESDNIMADRLSDKLREFLKSAEGRDVDLAYLRRELHIDPSSSSDANLRKLMSETFVEEKLVKPSGRRDGVYRVIRQIQPVRVFLPNRERRPIFNLKFPRDSKTGEQIDIAEHIIVREGDLLTIGGVKNKGKTALCLLFAAENITLKPVLMGNEYTIFTDNHYDPAPRFLSRLDRMADWVTWTDKDGYDRFTLLPAQSDYAEHIERNKLNIIDWVNLEGSELYTISKVLEGIKSALGRGIGIVAIQKSEGSINPRGGQFVRDFSDLELLLDGYGDNEDDILMTIRGAKEVKGRVVGKTFAYRIVEGGTQIYGFREVKKCTFCRGTGYSRGGLCGDCGGKKFVDI